MKTKQIRFAKHGAVRYTIPSHIAIGAKWAIGTSEPGYLLIDEDGNALEVLTDEEVDNDLLVAKSRKYWWKRGEVHTNSDCTLTFVQTQSG